MKSSAQTTGTAISKVSLSEQIFTISVTICCSWTPQQSTKCNQYTKHSTAHNTYDSLAYLFPYSFHQCIFCVLGVCVYLQSASTVMPHNKRPDPVAKVEANLFLFGIEPNTLSNQLSTLEAPDIEWHLKPAACTKPSAHKLPNPQPGNAGHNITCLTQVFCNPYMSELQE